VFLVSPSLFGGITVFEVLFRDSMLIA
jgi:hypothetical protein